MRRLIVGAIAVMVLASAGTALAETYTAPGQPNVLTVDSDANKVSFWCEPDDAGIKYEPVATPYIVPEPPEGKVWTLLVIKSALVNDQFPNPVVGQAYNAVSEKDISHVILCWEDTVVTTTTTTSSTTTTTPSTTTTTTTSTTVPTTTTEPTTTTTDPTSTTSSSIPTTSTTVIATTTVPPSSSTTSSNPTSTVPPTTTTVTVPTTLPVTGPSVNMGLGWLALFAVALIVLGGATVVGSLRKRSAGSLDT